MIIISKLSRASLFWCVYLSDSRQSLQVFCIQNKARHSSAKQIINKLMSLLLENVHFFPQSALQYFRKTLISILSMFFFSLPTRSSPHLIDVGILGVWGFSSVLLAFFLLLKFNVSLLFVSRMKPFLLIIDQWGVRVSHVHMTSIWTNRKWSRIAVVQITDKKQMTQREQDNWDCLPALGAPLSMEEKPLRGWFEGMWQGNYWKLLKLKELLIGLTT